MVPMKPLLVLRQLWTGHRWPLCAVVLLVLANIALLLILRGYLVPTVTAQEQLLIGRQGELREGGSGGSPVQQIVRGEKELAAFRAKIPPHREFTGLIHELQEMADAAGLDIAQVSYKHEPDIANQLLRYQLAFTIAGNYRDVKHFVHALEQSPRLIIIQQLGLQGVDQEQATDVQLQLTLETFFKTGTT